MVISRGRRETDHLQSLQRGGGEGEWNCTCHKTCSQSIAFVSDGDTNCDLMYVLQKNRSSSGLSCFWGPHSQTVLDVTAATDKTLSPNCLNCLLCPTHTNINCSGWKNSNHLLPLQVGARQNKLVLDLLRNSLSFFEKNV